MKFNWGTGILIFLILFLLAAAAFIIFAFKQNVNLVHKDYYKRGTDYTTQMNINARSAIFYDSLETFTKGDFLVIEFRESLASKIDSGRIKLFRPSDSSKDLEFLLTPQIQKFEIPKQSMVHGRYILKTFWYFGELKYEVNKPVYIE